MNSCKCRFIICKYHVGGYYDLPYLITQNSVLYALSSKVFVGGGNSVASIFPSALSVAPTYKGTTSPSLSSREAYRDNLAELYGAEDEVKWVSQIFHVFSAKLVGCATADTKTVSLNFIK